MSDPMRPSLLAPGPSQMEMLEARLRLREQQRDEARDAAEVYHTAWLDAMDRNDSLEDLIAAGNRLISQQAETIADQETMISRYRDEKAALAREMDHYK